MLACLKSFFFWNVMLFHCHIAYIVFSKSPVIVIFVSLCEVLLLRFSLCILVEFFHVSCAYEVYGPFWICGIIVVIKLGENLAICVSNISVLSFWRSLLQILGHSRLCHSSVLSLLAPAFFLSLLHFRQLFTVGVYIYYFLCLIY